jgi:signal transduction histidine kinase
MRKRTGYAARGRSGPPWLVWRGETGAPPADRYEPERYERERAAPDQPEADWYDSRRRRPRRWWRGPRRPGPLRRPQENRLVAGVCGAVAEKIGFDITVVRVIFVLMSLGSGFGLALYVVIWLLVPAAGDDSNIASKALTDRRGLALAAGAASLLALVLFTGAALGIGWFDSLAFPLIISVGGLVLIFRNAPPAEQATMRRIAEPLIGLTRGGRPRTLWWRAILACVLLAAGLSVLLSGHRDLALLRPLGGVALVIAAIVLMLGPWWLRIATDLVTERQARIRAEERADMAARVHDSVLQTLALIQRRAEDPQQVTQLARAQERELRSWLFDGQAPGSLGSEGLTFAGGVRHIQQEVEAQHGVPVEAVTVGDCELDDDLAALLGAAREAVVNAVKWSGAQVVSVFAEVEAAQVSVFVRDRGRGFDPAAVPADRKGLAESVRARMTRRGGSATIRSVQGEGTEVSLTMPRAARQRQSSRA